MHPRLPSRNRYGHCLEESTHNSIVAMAVRNRSFPWSIVVLLCLFWLVSVATEWSFQQSIEQLLSEQHAHFQVEKQASASSLRINPTLEVKAQQDIQAVSQPSIAEEESHFVCDTAPETAKRHRPILMLSNSRTGSNLFFSFIGRLTAQHADKVDSLLLYEIFADERDLQAEKLCYIVDQISRGCGWETNGLYIDRKFATPTTAQRKVLIELRDVFEQRYSNPARLMYFLHRIPSLRQDPFFALKVFPYHIYEQMNATVAEFSSIFSKMDPEYVILWRRNVLEIYVSLRIAFSKNGWTLHGTTKDDAVVLNHDELDWYVQHVTDFFVQARDYFEINSIAYEEFEYNRDIVDEKNHPAVVKQIQTRLLNQEANDAIIEAVFEPPTLAKQATVPVSEQIVNWEDVQSWGYSATTQDWPDLFSQTTLNKNGNAGLLLEQ